MLDTTVYCILPISLQSKRAPLRPQWAAFSGGIFISVSLCLNAVHTAARVGMCWLFLSSYKIVPGNLITLKPPSLFISGWIKSTRFYERSEVPIFVKWKKWRWLHIGFHNLLPSLRGPLQIQALVWLSCKKTWDQRSWSTSHWGDRYQHMMFQNARTLTYVSDQWCLVSSHWYKCNGSTAEISAIVFPPSAAGCHSPESWNWRWACWWVLKTLNVAPLLLTFPIRGLRHLKWSKLWLIRSLNLWQSDCSGGLFYIIGRLIVSWYNLSLSLGLFSF